jgi:hypothetical protein
MILRGCQEERLPGPEWLGCYTGPMLSSSRKARLWSYTRLQSEDATPIVCPTPVGRYNFGYISRLWSHFPTLVIVMTPVIDRAACLTYFLWKTTHGWARWLHMTCLAFETSTSPYFICSSVRPCATWPTSTYPGLIWEKPEYPRYPL